MSTQQGQAYQQPENLKSRLATSYNIIAPIYNAWTVKHADTRLTWLDKLLRHLPAQTDGEIRVLELGAGAGLPTAKALLVHNPNVHVIANDLSSHQLQLLQQNLSAYADRITAIEGDMFTLTTPPSSLTAVIGMYSLIHLPRQEQTQLLGKISTWLQPGGVSR
jgi:ubiquinone/menaquinone biosynthesis C-methylase UbiE